MPAVLRMAEKAAASTIPVLVAGESGVGKELIARAIHGSGERRAKPFVAVNCGAMPENLVESILFGHEKGSFTGATERHVGKFVEASGGTLFLDEVGELPAAAQVKLLRAIQEGEVEPVGARKPIKVDVRIVSATNRDLIADVKAGRFREDLFYRLHVFPITVPPLRERAGRHPGADPAFPGALCRRRGQAHPPDHAGGAAHARGLLAGRAISASSKTRCSAPWCWPRATPSGSPNSRKSRRRSQRRPGSRRCAGPCRRAAGAGLRPAGSLPEPSADRSRAAVGHGVPPASADALPLFDAAGEVRPLEELEAELIRYAITHYRGQMSEVARRLQIGRSTLYRKLEALGLNTERDEADSEGVATERQPLKIA